MFGVRVMRANGTKKKIIFMNMNRYIISFSKSHLCKQSKSNKTYKNVTAVNLNKTEHQQQQQQKIKSIQIGKYIPTRYDSLRL